MRVADLMELLSHTDQDAEVRYSVLSSSEYGEAVKDDAVVKVREAFNTLDDLSVTLKQGG